MKIILMRHGKPILAKTGWITPAEMAQWIERYDFAEVEAAPIPAASLNLAKSAALIVASTAPRALSSVQVLGHTAFAADAVYCEAQLPYASWRFPRLPPSVWAVFFRVLWAAGYAREVDSVRDTRVRAKAAAQQLISLAEKGTVLLLGHGIMNRFIARELAALGWTASGKQGSKYWSASVYVGIT